MASIKLNCDGMRPVNEFDCSLNSRKRTVMSLYMHVVGGGMVRCVVNRGVVAEEVGTSKRTQVDLVSGRLSS